MSPLSILVAPPTSATPRRIKLKSVHERARGKYRSVHIERHIDSIVNAVAVHRSVRRDAATVCAINSQPPRRGSGGSEDEGSGDGGESHVSVLGSALWLSWSVITYVCDTQKL
jgi:hypothetical protein